MAVDVGTKIDALHEELVLIRARLDALEELLSEEEASEEDRAALEEALEEHKRGETMKVSRFHAVAESSRAKLMRTA